MIDTHCHIDLYQNPTKIALQTEQEKITTILVTNLPSLFEKSYPHTRGFKYIRLALGLHPLMADLHNKEKKLFEKLVDKTSYIGEVGLDFSVNGEATKSIQIESFRFVLNVIKNKPKFISIHSRKAESAVLDILDEEKRVPGVLHWYSGSTSELDRAVSKGHYFSINPAMVNSKSGKKIIDRIPPERILTETDGPFVKLNNTKVLPKDVSIVENYLAILWSKDKNEVSKVIKNNFYKLIHPLILNKK